jgi:uncharacterized coiled-coil protein SlyX
MATDSTAPPIRALSFSLSNGKFEDLPGGALLIHDVKALAEGVWTDSHVQTALFYPARTLEQYAANWNDSTFWYEHTGGMGHPKEDDIGNVFNPRFLNNAITVDIMLHGMNEKSRERIGQIKSRELNMVSIEHGGEEWINPTTRRLEAKTLEIYGLVPVVKGACKVCNIRNNSSPEGLGMELKELTETFAGKADTVKELSDMKAQNKALVERLDAAEKKIKELSDAPKIADTTDLVKAQAEQIKELAEKVKKLEAAPAGTKTTVAQVEEEKLIIIR